MLAGKHLLHKEQMTLDEKVSFEGKPIKPKWNQNFGILTQKKENFLQNMSYESLNMSGSYLRKYFNLINTPV